MNKEKFSTILLYIIVTLASIIILSSVFMGCDKIKCSPQFDLNGTYIGIKCGGNF